MESIVLIGLGAPVHPLQSAVTRAAGRRGEETRMSAPTPSRFACHPSSGRRGGFSPPLTRRGRAGPSPCPLPQAGEGPYGLFRRGGVGLLHLGRGAAAEPFCCQLAAGMWSNASTIYGSITRCRVSSESQPPKQRAAQPRCASGACPAGSILLSRRASKGRDRAERRHRLEAGAWAKQSLARLAPTRASRADDQRQLAPGSRALVRTASQLRAYRRARTDSSHQGRTACCHRCGRLSL